METEPGPVTLTSEDVPAGFIVSDSKEIDRELDDAVAAESSRLKSDKEEPPEKADKPKAGPPRLDEWQDLFSRILIRSATDWYINWAFRGIDEDALSDREVDKITMNKEERDRIARPFAELSNKSPFMRKHGRAIVSLTDSWDSVIALGMWYSRVSRIARKYHRMQTRTVQGYVNGGQDTRPSAPQNGHRAASDREPGQQFFPYGPGTG